MVAKLNPLTFLLGLALTILFVINCRLLPSSKPEITHHSPPTLSLDSEPFRLLGCLDSFEAGRACAQKEPFVELGCDQIREADNLLGALQPLYPIALCLTIPPDRAGKEPQENEYLYNDGCLLPIYVHYVIFKDGTYKLIKNKAELQTTFAPVQSAYEALSYALAATGYSAFYNIDAPGSYRYFVDQIEDTHVETSEDGYLVHLFYGRICGCGPHPTYTFDFLVKEDGSMEEVSREKIYENPEQDDLCMD